MKYLFALLWIVVSLSLPNSAHSMPMATPATARVELSQISMAAALPIEPAKPKAAKKMPLRPLARLQRREDWDLFSFFAPIPLFILFPLSLVLILLGISFISWWWGLVAIILFFVGAWINVFVSLNPYDGMYGIAAAPGLVTTLSLVLIAIVGALALFFGLSYSIMAYTIAGVIGLGLFLLFALLAILYAIALANM